MTSKKEVLIAHHVVITTASKNFLLNLKNDSTTLGVSLRGHAAIAPQNIETVGSDTYCRISLPYVEEPSLDEEYCSQETSTRSSSDIFEVENGK
jgi:hypothetical protein